MDSSRRTFARRTSCVFLAILLVIAPVLALAQAASPFMTGATALQTNILGGWGCAARAVSAVPTVE